VKPHLLNNLECSVLLMREALSRSRWLATTAAIRIRQSEAALHRCGLRCTVRFDESPSRAGTVSLFRRHRRSVGACLQPSLSLLSASSSCFAFKELGSFGHGERRPVTIGTHQLALPTLIDLQVTRDRPEGRNKEKAASVRCTPSPERQRRHVPRREPNDSKRTAHTAQATGEGETKHCSDSGVRKSTTEATSPRHPAPCRRRRLAGETSGNQLPVINYR
jgi:hypothetical protein